MKLINVTLEDDDLICELSDFASEVVKDYYDPIIGPEQNDYMITLFQSVKGIREQLGMGEIYYLLTTDDDKKAGFVCFFQRNDEMYLNKFYLHNDYRGRGYGGLMLDLVKEHARKLGLNKITLNVNKNNPTVKIYEKMGFYVIREEKNPIGRGFYMDDYVYQLDL
ncbi:MAG: GNAT family N-acetyltransferase [Clostridiales bacterium]|nr:GNAT family N-acetyltransferase [Clostridiales bacterium]